MTWSYSGDPSASGRDAVRFLTGDTDSTDQQLSDEEIDYLLADEGSVAAAAVAAVRALVAGFARLVDKSVGDLRLSYSQRVAHYEALLAQLERRHALRTAGVIAGGISRDRKETVEADSDRVEPDFARGQFDHPGNMDPSRSDICD